MVDSLSTSSSATRKLEHRTLDKINGQSNGSNLGSLAISDPDYINFVKNVHSSRSERGTFILTGQIEGYHITFITDVRAPLTQDEIPQPSHEAIGRAVEIYALNKEMIHAAYPQATAELIIDIPRRKLYKEGEAQADNLELPMPSNGHRTPPGILEVTQRRGFEIGERYTGIDNVKRWPAQLRGDMLLGHEEEVLKFGVDAEVKEVAAARLVRIERDRAVEAVRSARKAAEEGKKANPYPELDSWPDNPA